MYKNGNVPERMKLENVRFIMTCVYSIYTVFIVALE